jgi:hypothetical protein
MNDGAMSRSEPLPLALAANLEQAAAALARLGSALAARPLAVAWAYRARLEAVRRQAAVDGKAIDPWHLAAVIEGVRLRLDPGAAPIERGAIFAAAGYACNLYRWYAAPDEMRRAAIAEAEAYLASVADEYSPLLGAAIAVHAWLDRGGDRQPLRAALTRYWTRRGVTALPCPLLTGAAALAPEIPWGRAVWVGHFLAAVAAEAEDGLALLRQIERPWFAARRAVAGRRRDSHAAAAVDILAAAPLLSATSLAQLLGIAIKNAIRLLDGFVVLGVAIEVTHRSKRRLYALKHLAPLREATAPPRRPQPGRRPGRPPKGQIGLPEAAPEPSLVLTPSPPLPALARHEFDFSDLDRLLDLTDQAIRRAQRILEVHQSNQATIESASPRDLESRGPE